MRVTAPMTWPAHRDVWRIAAPMILTNVSVPMLGIVDTAVLGHLPDPAYLGAVAIGAMIFSFVFWGFGFLRMGTTGFVAQAHGRGNEAAVSRHLYQALSLALVCAAALLLAQRGIRDLALWATEANAQVESGAAVYFDIRIWAAPMTLSSHALVGWFLGMQNARVPMMMLLTANLSNVILDVFFVVGLGWGVAGVAWASLIGETLGVLVGLVLLRSRFAVVRPPWREILDRSELTAMFRVNRDIMIRTLCLIFVFAFIPWWGARLGEVVLAANAVLINFQHFMSYALDGFAHAAEALAGKALGGSGRAGFRRAVVRSGQWSAMVAVVFCLAYWIAGEGIIRGLTDLPGVRATAMDYLPWMIALPAISVWSYWLDGVFIGATWARAMRISMAVAALGVFLPAWWLSRGWGNHGLWFAFALFMAARGVLMGWFYRREERRLPGCAVRGEG